MRAFIITFSSIALGLLIVLGPVSNVWSGWQIDVPTPYNYPSRVAGTLLGDAPGLIFALAGLGYALYDAAQRNAPRWFIALLIWPVIPLLAASLMYARALSYAIFWFAPLALIPLASFIYGLIAASPGQRPAAPAPAPRRYVTFVGFLAAVTVALGAFLITPPPADSVLVSPPVLQVSTQQSSANCAKGIYPQITLANVGSQVINWTARSQDVTITPASGTLAPNSEMQVALEGTSPARQVNIQFTPDIGTGSVITFYCQ